ncbi:MAG: hypothetical protein K0Q73_6464, partial [Paenibacillus sp.]|nr:hypothetical protein [Paenibacillus sp.]
GTQLLNGSYLSTSTQTDRNGNYALNLYPSDVAGEAEIRISDYSGLLKIPDAIRLDIPYGGTQYNPTLPRLVEGYIILKVLNKRVDGQMEGPEKVDAAKLKEWNVTLRDRNGTRGYLDEYPIRTYGFPGDEVELCISNYNLVYEGCKKVQTDQDNSAIFEMTFEEQSKFLAKVMQNDAMVHDENISTYLSRWDESNGNWSSLATLKMNPIDISLPAGKYQYEISSYHGGNVAGEFELIDGDVYDAGEIEIVQIGRFAGWPGNELTSTLSQAVPGDVIPMRGAFRNPYGSETSDTYLNIEIPKGTELVAGSVVYGGTPILETTVTDSVYSIRLGEVGAYVQGNIRYKLKLSDSYSATDLIARLSMTWQGGQETIARKVIPTSFVSMDVQSTVHSDTLQISGRAPGNAIVTLFDGSAVIGQTKAYPGGYWTAQVKLADLGQPSRHLLRAEASWNGKIEVTDIYLVIFEPDEARLQQLVMKQFNGKVVTINPENGVARFPFTIHPSLATTFEAHFAEPDRVEAVRLRFAGDEPVEMEQDQNGVFRADVIAGYKAGKVYIEYKTKKPSNLSKTESELKASLPPALRNFTDNVTLIDQDQAAGKQGGVQFDMGNLHITSETYSLPNDGYQLTDEEEQETEAGTVKAFNPKLEWTLDGTKLDIELSYYVPIPEQKVASKQHGRVQILSFIGTGFKLIKREFSVDLKDKERLEKMREKLEEANENVEDGKDAIEQISANFDISVEFASRMQRLEMLAALAATCPKTNEIENPFILRKMNYVAVQSTTITVVSLVNFLNPIPIDVIGIDPLGDAIDRIGNQLDESIDRMEESIRSSIQFFCPPDDNGDGSGGTGGTSGSGSKGGGSGGGWSGGAAADPVYIYDPSGYVYEAVEDNRVEGVKATVFQLQDGKWVAWDAEWFGQFNPQTTDTEGKYAWDVPNGMWKVVYEKEGYLPTQSAELEVPPPHFDVNVPIVSLEAPTATSIEGFTTSGSEANTEILVNFSKYIDTGLALNGAITVTKGGNAVTGTISAPSAQIDSSGRSLTQSLLFKLTAAESPQSTLAVAIDNAYVVSYAGTMMVADYETNITVVDKDVVGPILSSTTIGAKGKEIRLLFNEGIDPNSLLSVEGITLEGTEALASGMVLDPTVAGNKGVKLLLDLAVASGGEIQINVAANRFRDLKGNGSSEIIQYSVNNNLPSSDVTLASLKINQGSIALQPAFSQSASRYTVSVPKGTDVVVDATASSTEASIRINEILYKGDSLLVNAEADETMIPIVVTAKNGTKGYYTVVVKRTLPDIGNGSGSGSGSAASPGRGLKIKEYLEESGIRVAEYEFTAADIQSRIIDGEAIIELSQQADKQVALMPVTVVQELIAKNGKLIVKTGEIKLVIPAAVMDQSAILKALGTTADQVKVRLQILKISDTSVHANLVNDAKGEGVLRNTGVVYEFLLQAEAGGSKLPISNFNDHPVTGEIAWMPEFQQLGAEHMVGVYKFNESNGQWVWTPSKVERANNRILFKTDSFSRYAVMAYGVNFTDTAAHWGRTNIEALASRSVIQGTGANRFEPEKQVTRAEFASMLVRAVGSVKTAKSGTTFPDVSEADWFHDAVLRAADMGIIHGYEDGTFRPKETITRQQMAVMIARSMSSTGLTPDGNTEDASKQLNGFNDKAEVQPWASAEMAQALKFGFIQGKGDRLLAPSDTATRAEAATMLLRLMNVISF